MHIFQRNGNQTRGYTFARDLQGEGIGAAVDREDLSSERNLNALSGLFYGGVNPRMNVGAPSIRGSLTKFKGFVFGQSGTACKGHVHRDRDRWLQLEAGRVGAGEGLLFLHRRHRQHVPFMIALSKFSQTFRDGNQRGPVVERMPGQYILSELDRRLSKGNQVTDADQASGVRQSYVHQEILERDRFAPQVLRQIVRGRLNHDPRKLAPAVNDHRLSRQHSRVEAANRHHPNKTLHKFRHHHPDRVHMGRQHHTFPGLLPGAALPCIQAADSTHLDFIRQWLPFRAHAPLDRTLITR